MNQVLLRVSLCIFFAFCITSGLRAQVKTSAQGTVVVGALTDQQLADLIKQARASGLSDTEIIENAKRNAVPASDLERLQAALTGNGVLRSDITDTSSRRRLNYQPDTLANVGVKARQGLQVFGTDLFANNNIRFEPSLTLATPLNYILGPGDQVNISVTGLSQANWKLDVSPEGNINIPGSGIVNVSGKTIQAATALIRSKLVSSRYTIGNGTNLQVTLGNIRSIKVIMIGQLQRPGTYTLPSLATVFNALYAAGGPNINGSLRKIEVIRNNRIVRKLDVYDFLVKGSQKDNINLQDQDIIRVPTYQTRVELSGQVKVPALFEVLPGESLQQVIDFAGGFTDSAYVARIKVSQIINQQRHITDILESDFTNYQPLRGDKFVAESIVNRYDNRVSIRGAVFRPGDYELDKGLTLSRLIIKAEGLKEDAFMDRGTITRLKPDNTTELIAFSVRDIIGSKQVIALQREDVINIASIFDLRDQYQLSITGAVRKPGNYAYAEGMKVEDLIFVAGGFANGASTVRIEVARRVDKTAANLTGSTIATVFTVNTNEQLSAAQGSFVLQPFDIVSVFGTPGYTVQRLVRVEGEVTYPGTYAITNRDEKISDLIKRAGGLTSLANIEGATLKRADILGGDVSQEARDTQYQRLSRSLSGSAETPLRNRNVGIDLKKILAKPGTDIDLIVKNDDVISVPNNEQVVNVNGEVLRPSAVVYQPGKSAKSYIENAGGFSALAWKKKPYVIYPNGSIESTKKFLFFKFYPTVRPGSEVYVPAKPVRNNRVLQDAFGITGGLASIAAIIFGIISISK